MAPKESTFQDEIKQQTSKGKSGQNYLVQISRSRHASCQHSLHTWVTLKKTPKQDSLVLAETRLKKKIQPKSSGHFFFAKLHYKIQS
jgi:hypothetical protein